MLQLDPITLVINSQGRSLYYTTQLASSETCDGDYIAICTNSDLSIQVDYKCGTLLGSRSYSSSQVCKAFFGDGTNWAKSLKAFSPPRYLVDECKKRWDAVDDWMVTFMIGIGSCVAIEVITACPSASRYWTGLDCSESSSFNFLDRSSSYSLRRMYKDRRTSVIFTCLFDEYDLFWRVYMPLSSYQLLDGDCVDDIASWQLQDSSTSCDKVTCPCEESSTSSTSICQESSTSSTSTCQESSTPTCQESSTEVECNRGSKLIDLADSSTSECVPVYNKRRTRLDLLLEPSNQCEEDFLVKSTKMDWFDNYTADGTTLYEDALNKSLSDALLSMDSQYYLLMDKLQECNTGDVDDIRAQLDTLKKVSQFNPTSIEEDITLLKDELSVISATSNRNTSLCQSYINVLQSNESKLVELEDRVRALEQYSVPSCTTGDSFDSTLLESRITNIEKSLLTVTTMLQKIAPSIRLRSQ